MKIWWALVLIACDGGRKGPAVDAHFPDIFADDAPNDASIDASIDTIDAPPDAFEPPPPGAILTAYDDTGTDLGAANLGCLNTPSSDVATTMANDLAITVRDFQNNSDVANASIALFPRAMTTTTLDTATSDANGLATVTLPTNQKRFGWSVLGSFQNYIVNDYFTGVATRTLRPMSNATAQTIPALIGITRTSGTALISGSFRDCANHLVGNFVATISSTTSVSTPLPGSDTYYFSTSNNLPVRHNVEAASTANGLFVIIEIQSIPTAFVQIWGYRTPTDLANGTLSLVGQLAIPLAGDAVTQVDLAPTRT